jgi:hypothetical protein
MAQQVTVDLANKLIIVNNGVTELDTRVDLYSDLKEDWLANAANHMGLEFPFRVVGGDPLGGTLTAGAYFFLRNDLGWRIRPFEGDHDLTILGNLFAEDAALPIFVPTLGDFTVSTRLQTSSLTQLAETGVSGLTPDESTKLDTIHGAATQLTYQAKVWLTLDDPSALDRYLVTLFQDGNPLGAGATVSVSIEVLAAGDGTTLFGPTAMSEIDGTNMFGYNSSVRTTAGRGYVIKLTSTIDGNPFEWLQPIGSEA